MDNLLVTGRAGFIGSSFIHYLFHHDQEVGLINLDTSNYVGNLEKFKELFDPDRYTFINGDSCDSG